MIGNNGKPKFITTEEQRTAAGWWAIGFLTVVFGIVGGLFGFVYDLSVRATCAGAALGLLLPIVAIFAIAIISSLFSKQEDP